MASKSIAENVKALMSENGHSNVKKFSKDVGLPYTTVHALLGGAQPTIKTLQAIASFYSVSLDFLVNGEESKHATLESMIGDVLYDGLLKVRIERVITKRK